MTTSEFYIASGMTNKVGPDRFFLVIDFDGISSGDLEDEVSDLQVKFSLSDATIYRTHSGYHAYFFFDNRISGEKMKEILSSSKLADRNFIETFDLMLAENQGVTIRLSGKYEKADIVFSRIIPGTRRPSILERNLGQSLSDSVKAILQSPIVDHKKYKISVESSGGPGNEKKTPVRPPVVQEVPLDRETEQAVAVEKAISGIPDIPDPENQYPETVSEKQAEEIFSNEDEEEIPEEDLVPEEKAKRLADVFPENDRITTLRKLWYRGDMSRSVARLISAATENTELALNKMPACIDVKEKDFTEYRPFFFSNDRSKELMLKPYLYVLDKARFDELPFNFFHSHAKYKIDDFENIPLKAFKKQKEFRNWMREHSREIATGLDMIFDIDSKDPQGTDSYVGTKKLRDLLQSMQIPFSVNFSGSKGFHVRIPSALLNTHVPELLEYVKKEPGNLRKFFNRILEFTSAHGIIVDEKAYSGDMRCQIRVQWSVHPATGSVVKPLTDAEFDALEGKTLAQIQEIYRVDNQLKGNPRIGAKKLNLQKNEFIVRIPVDEDVYLTWQEAKEEGRPDWEEIRSVTNQVTKELRALSNNHPKEFNQLMVEGVYKIDDYGNYCLVEAPEWIDLMTGRNFDYLRKGSTEALREFVLSLIK